MTHPVPVKIGDQTFSSMNKARICYTDILHRYPLGSPLVEADRQHVLQLLSEQQIGRLAPIQQVQVVRAQYGRSCFEMCSSKDTRQ